MKKKSVGLWAAVGVALIPAMALADAAPAAPAAPAGPSLSDVLVNSGITVAGYASASYNATFNSTSGATVGQVPLHQFDTNSNTFELNQAALTVSYLPTSGFGAMVNLIAGEDAKIINQAYSGGSSPSGSDFALTQGYLQYAVGNLTVIGGRFVTLAGEEVIDDSKNANVSRSLLFTNLEPLVHTGVRASYKFSDLITGIVGLNNSAITGASADTDKHKTVELGAAITPSSTISLALADYYSLDGGTGSGTTAVPNTKTNYLDAVASWQATTALLLAANFDYVHAATSGAGTGNKEGVALYGTYQVNDSWKGSLRGEYARLKPAGAIDPSTGLPGNDADVMELTATVDYSAAKNFDVLGELREDYGTALYFPSGNNTTFGAQKSQGEVLVKAIYKFGTPVPSS